MVKKTTFIIIGFLCTLISFVYIFQQYRVAQLKDINVILISVDTVRSDKLSSYGYERITDPNISKFAERALIFNQAYTPIPQTYPSFATLFTGISPFSSKIYSNVSPSNSDIDQIFQNTKPIGSETETISKILKREGYYNVSFVTSGIIHPDFTNFNDGFDVYNQYPIYDINDWKQERETYNAFIDTAVSWFSENKEKKFFYWIHLMDPHSPYFPPTKNNCKYQSNENCTKLQAMSFDEINSFNSEYYACVDKPISEDTLDLYKGLYDSEIEESDKLVGRVLDSIKENGLMENSLIIFYSDHGESFDHQYYFAHGEVLYNSTVKIPLIISHPMITSKKHVSETVFNTDILPTIMDLLSIEYDKKKYDGESFVKFFYDISLLKLFPFTKTESKYYYFANFNLTKFAVMKDNYKYIYSFPNACVIKNQNIELYDLKADPFEKDNIISREKEIASVLQKQLLDYIEKHNLSPKSENDLIKNKDILNELKSLGY